MEQNERDQINQIFDKVAHNLSYLYDRWQDEREYEDFKMYEKAMRDLLKEVQPEAYFIKATKRPFGYTFNFNGLQIQFKVTSKNMQWTARRLLEKVA